MDMYEMGKEASDQDALEFLEGTVDAAGMQYLIDRAAAVCWAKAEHLLSAWQDEATARKWEQLAVALDSIEVNV
jgi:hypothetical protein